MFEKVMLSLMVSSLIFTVSGCADVVEQVGTVADSISSERVETVETALESEPGDTFKAAYFTDYRFVERYFGKILENTVEASESGTLGTLYHSSDRSQLFAATFSSEFVNSFFNFFSASEIFECNAEFTNNYRAGFLGLNKPNELGFNIADTEAFKSNFFKEVVFNEFYVESDSWIVGPQFIVVISSNNNVLKIVETSTSGVIERVKYFAINEGNPLEGQEYVQNEDGSLTLDENGNFIPVPQTDGSVEGKRKSLISYVVNNNEVNGASGYADLAATFEIFYNADAEFKVFPNTSTTLDWWMDKASEFAANPQFLDATYTPDASVSVLEDGSFVVLYGNYDDGLKTYTMSGEGPAVMMDATDFTCGDVRATDRLEFVPFGSNVGGEPIPEAVVE